MPEPQLPTLGEVKPPCPLQRLEQHSTKHSSCQLGTSRSISWHPFIGTRCLSNQIYRAAAVAKLMFNWCCNSCQRSLVVATGSCSQGRRSAGLGALVAVGSLLCLVCIPSAGYCATRSSLAQSVHLNLQGAWGNECPALFRCSSAAGWCHREFTASRI